ncbi:hypothetical protein Dsin_011666 [Dipteronia sinensis]|uniref:Reverse transcriptase domain-containing protein n=1 Tax=Dipteronia sinensis TaxID=43782 RepID=A0AAE0AGU7_9ROSI|nr:hypothetical protein Dsin_011666 [Dipteronia sinensis]
MSDQGFSEELFLVKSIVYHDLDVLLSRNECFYRDQSRVKWLQNGDRNSTFFYASIWWQQYRKTLSTILINGVLSNDRLVIRDHIVCYYSAFFSSDSSKVGYDFLMVDVVISNMVTVDENCFLIDIPSAEDIHDTGFPMDTSSTLGLDGFSGKLYQHCWEVVDGDVILALQDFFSSRTIFPSLNSSFIVLLPKLRDLISIDQYRHIVLSNFLFKISSNILADHLARITARIVSLYQFGFVRDRHIEDCISLASDCMNVLHKKCYMGHLAMQIDIRKAFNTLDWFFLGGVLQAFGFFFVFLGWIGSIMISLKLSVLVNGYQRVISIVLEESVREILFPLFCLVSWLTGANLPSFWLVHFSCPDWEIAVFGWHADWIVTFFFYLRVLLFGGFPWRIVYAESSFIWLPDAVFVGLVVSWLTIFFSGVPLRLLFRRLSSLLSSGVFRLTRGVLSSRKPW